MGEAKRRKERLGETYWQGRNTSEKIAQAIMDTHANLSLDLLHEDSSYYGRTMDAMLAERFPNATQDERAEGIKLAGQAIRYRVEESKRNAADAEREAQEAEELHCIMEAALKVIPPEEAAKLTLGRACEIMAARGDAGAARWSKHFNDPRVRKHSALVWAAAEKHPGIEVENDCTRSTFRIIDPTFHVGEDGAELIEWFQVNYPLEARAIEAEGEGV